MSSRLGLRFPPNGSTQLNSGVEKGGEVIVQEFQLRQNSLNTVREYTFELPEKLHEEIYLAEVFGYYHATTKKIQSEWSHDSTLVSIGGDHSISYSSLAAVLERFGTNSVGLVMIDSHADLHLPSTSPSGNFHGMWLRPFLSEFDQYSVQKSKILPAQVQYIGNLELESEESDFISRNDIPVTPSAHITTEKIAQILSWATQYPHLHISFDIDVFDQSIIAATGTPNPHGFQSHEVFQILQQLKKHPSISLDIVEYNPHKDEGQKSLRVIEKVWQTFFDNE